jgi:hypothetical protein
MRSSPACRSLKAERPGAFLLIIVLSFMMILLSTELCPETREWFMHEGFSGRFRAASYFAFDLTQHF